MRQRARRGAPANRQRSFMPSPTSSTASSASASSCSRRSGYFAASESRSLRARACHDAGMPETSAWGPLAALIGEWEGDQGLDVSFINATGRITETKFRETVTMAPFGPVANGTQTIYGLDYRMAAF